MSSCQKEGNIKENGGWQRGDAKRRDLRRKSNKATLEKVGR